jgi:soluble lytic murein transglycosylase
MPTQTNALHARLRMEIYRQRWNEAIKAADDLLALNDFSGAMAGSDEVKYLKAIALERGGRRNEAMAVYASISNSSSSYYSGLAADRALKVSKMKTIAQVAPTDFPVVYRSEVTQEAKKRNLDPRFVLAVMKQESTFNAGAKSPSAARGLLQLTYDTALKYNKQAGYPSFEADDLYNPRMNIAIGTQYMASLRDQFNGLYEAIAASYNGGEDNAARWLNRSNPKEAAIFASEIGFAETKNYVFKVMTNYRIYRELYDENLNRR